MSKRGLSEGEETTHFAAQGAIPKSKGAPEKIRPWKISVEEKASEGKLAGAEKCVVMTNVFNSKADRGENTW